MSDEPSGPEIPSHCALKFFSSTSRSHIWGCCDIIEAIDLGPDPRAQISSQYRCRGRPGGPHEISEKLQTRNALQALFILFRVQPIGGTQIGGFNSGRGPRTRKIYMSCLIIISAPLDRAIWERCEIGPRDKIWTIRSGTRSNGPGSVSGSEIGGAEVRRI